MFTIDFTSRVPIYEQICNNVIIAVLLLMIYMRISHVIQIRI